MNRIAELESAFSKMNDWLSQTIPLVGGPCDRRRSSYRTPGYEFTGFHFGHGLKARYRVADDGQSAVYIKGSECPLSQAEIDDVD